MRLPLLLLALTACTSGMYETAEIDQGACVVLEGRTFGSPGDQITFSSRDSMTSDVSWTHESATETGRASCRDQVITATVGRRVISGTFDLATQRLSWSGETYAAP